MGRLRGNERVGRCLFPTLNVSNSSPKRSPYSNRVGRFSEVGWRILEAREHRFSCIPDLQTLDIIAYQLLQVCRQGFAVDLGA